MHTLLTRNKDPLRGTLFQYATLDQDFKYDALSYRWTDFNPEVPNYIAFGDVNFAIGPNLHAALFHLRRESLSRYLWIDQICINQNDKDEKLSQMQIMGEIYSKAQSVLIWLGKADEQSDLAMQLFPILVKQVQHEEEISDLRQANERPVSFDEWTGRLGTSIWKLFLNSWFGRVWTLQEAALGREAEVWCGTKSFPFRLVEDFGKGCDKDRYGYWGKALSAISFGSKSSDPENPDRFLTTHVHIITTLKENNYGSSARLLNSLRILDSTAHEDRIYSVLRFLDLSFIRNIEQSQDRSPAKLYHLVAMQELRDGNLNYLGAAGLSQQRRTYQATRADSTRPYLPLPSWVPDWTFIPLVHSYWVLSDDCRQKKGIPLYTAGGLHQSDNDKIFFSKNDKALHIPGTWIDDIVECTARFNLLRLPENLGDLATNYAIATTVVRDYRAYIASCMQLASQCVPQYGAANIQRACRHSLVGSMMSSTLSTTRTGVLVRASNQIVDSMFEQFERFSLLFDEMDWFINRTSTGTPLTTDELARAQGALVAQQQAATSSMTGGYLLQAIAENCKGRRFFITGKRQYMGVAPDIAEPGDKICIVPGSCAPFVVRPKGEHFQLIGECYVHGIMDGEAMKMGDLDEQIVVLE